MPQTNAQVTLQVSGVTQAEVEAHKTEYNHILAQVLPLKHCNRKDERPALDLQDACQLQLSGGT